MPTVSMRLDPALLWVLILAIGLQALYLPPWSWLILSLALGWRAGAQWLDWRLPPTPVLVVAAAVSALLVFFHYHSLWGRDAGVALLTLTASLKLLETRLPRDRRVLLLMGFFLSISLLLFDQGMLTALVVLLLFAGLVTAWLGIDLPSPPSMGLRMRMATQLLLLAMPVALVLFLLFPRPPGGLWGVQQPVAGEARTGLSDTLSAGSFDALSKDPTPAFRVQFDGAIPPPPARYWRVLVMDRSVDGVWQAALPNFNAPVPKNVGMPLGDTRRYTITLEPSDRRFVPSLTLPIGADLPPSLLLDRSGALFSRQPLTDRTRLTVVSALDYALEPRLSAAERRRDLQLPPGNPQLKALGKTWQSLSPDAARDAALRYFHTQDFHYTLTPGRLTGENRMDQFLFETRRGYCEHYAEAFTLLMRAAGVPARIVTGYQGGEVISDYLLIRQADAHAWSEIWVDKFGWVRVDPTAAVAPERIDTGLAAAAAQDAALPAILRGGDSFSRQFARRLDQVQNGWNQYVLAYSGDTQLDLLRFFKLDGLSRWQQFLLALLISAGLWWVMMRWWQTLNLQRSSDVIDRAWQPMADALDRLGLSREAGESWKTHTERISSTLPPDLAKEWNTLAQQFSHWRYAAQTSRQRQQRIAAQSQRLARKIRKRLRKGMPQRTR